jgi:large subunit ribosomal protein L33
MAKKSTENRIIITLRSSESGATYTTIKNKRNDPARIELKKYDPVLRKHVTFKETK